MKHLILISLLLASHPVFAGDAAQEHLRKQYVNSSQTLNKFYSGNYLKYDSDGNFVGNSDTGPWTVYGELLIDELNLKSDKLEIQAHRAILVYDRDRSRLVGRPWRGFVILEIATATGPGQLARLRAALQHIFVNSRDEMLAALPDYWRSYYTKVTSTDPAATTSKPPTPSGTNGRPGNETQPGGNPSGSPTPLSEVPRKLRVSSGVAEGLLTKKVSPTYLPIAKAAHAQGDCIMQATIGKDGNLSKLSIIQPVGAGLDDEAVRAVSQWQYRPYALQGQLVEVDTTITIRFHL